MSTNPVIVVAVAAGLISMLVFPSAALAMLAEDDADADSVVICRPNQLTCLSFFLRIGLMSG